MAVRSSWDTLIDIFEQIENFFRRLEVYIDIPLTIGMMDIIVKIICKVLSVLTIVMKEIKQGKASKLIPSNGASLPTYDSSEAFLNRLVGRTDIESALHWLDKLTQDKVRMATAQGLKATHGVDDRVRGINVKIDSFINGVQIIFHPSSLYY